MSSPLLLPPQSDPDPIKTTDIKVDDGESPPPQTSSRASACVKLLALLLFLPLYLTFALVLHIIAAIFLTLALLPSAFIPSLSTSVAFKFRLLWESFFLNTSIPVMLIRYKIEDVITPSSAATPQSMSALLTLTLGKQQKVTKVTNNAPSSDGVAGEGTERQWLKLEVEGGGEVCVFMKNRTRNFAESFFLNLFGVYANEMSFYRELQASTGASPSSLAFQSLPAQFFPSVHHAGMTTYKSDFRLVLEDVIAVRVSPTRRITFLHLSPDQVHSKQGVLEVLTTQATLHAAFYKRPPLTVWRSERPASAPPFLQIVMRATLKQAVKVFSDVLTPEIVEVYNLFLNNFATIRSYIDKTDNTMVHGDAHIGNYFFDETLTANGEVAELKARMCDFQCVAVEHPIRDVVYHVLSSVSPDVVTELGGDEAIVHTYLEKFNTNLNGRHEPIKFEEAWFSYKVHSLFVVNAWVTSAGASDKIFDVEKARFSLNRICRGMERIGVKEIVEALKVVIGGEEMAW